MKERGRYSAGKRWVIIWLAAFISLGSAGHLTSQETGKVREQWYERGLHSRSPSSPAEAMIERQLRGRGIRDPGVLRVMRSVPREKFVPKELQTSAYDDRPLPSVTGRPFRSRISSPS
jgi:hypothetical protein